MAAGLKKSENKYAWGRPCPKKCHVALCDPIVISLDRRITISSVP
jgi:hypothetical protein